MSIVDAPTVTVSQTTVNTHLNDEVKWQRRVVAAELGEALRFDQDDIPVRGEVVVYDTYDSAGVLLGDTPLPDDADFTDVLFPNDIIASASELTFVYRGMYWIEKNFEKDEHGTDIAVLHLGKAVRCPKYEWCDGHHFNFEGDGLEQVDGDDERHMGRSETIHTFAEDLPKQKVAAIRELDAEGESLYVTIDVEKSFTRDSLRVFALDLLKVSEKLLERGAQISAESCPRCSGPLRVSSRDQGALSRVDNETIICGRCVGAEAEAGL